MIFAAVTIVHMEKHFKILKAASLIVKENTRISIQDNTEITWKACAARHNLKGNIAYRYQWRCSKRENKFVWWVAGG